MDSDARLTPARAAKARARLDVRGRIAALSATERARADEAICRRLQALEQELEQKLEMSQARELRGTFVVGYLALPDEVRVEEFLSMMVSTGKVVLVPRVHGGRLRFGSWNPGVRLSRDEKGVMAPENATFESLPAGMGLIVVPGRAFDVSGRRLGRGGGYYDVLLSALPREHVLAGVSYECQLIESVPWESHDRGVEMIVTESRLRRIAPATSAVSKL